MLIAQTEDYNLFKRISGNRGVNKAHVGRLVQAISENAEMTKYTPIVVNENYEVIDGQHRLEALTQLGLPVHYIKGEGLDLSNVQGLNSMNKPWTPMDFARSYAELGNKHYQLYIEFKTGYHLNHDILLAYLGVEDPITPQMFKTGRLKVKQVSKSHDLCRKLVEIGQIYPGYNRRSFALAFKRMWQNPDFEQDKLVAKLKGSELQDYALPEDYLRAMEKMYNSHARNGVDRVR